MKDPGPKFVSEKNKETNEPIFLYTFHDYDGQGGDLRYVDYDKDIVFDSKNYSKAPIAHDVVEENTEGSINAVRLTVGNASRYIQALLEDPNYKFRGKKVTIRMVWRDHLDDPNCYVDDIFYIDSCSTDQLNAYFMLSTKFDILRVMLPGEMFLRGHCRYASKDDGFKGPRCVYSGEETECNRTWQRCKELENQQPECSAADLAP